MKAPPLADTLGLGDSNERKSMKDSERIRLLVEHVGRLEARIQHDEERWAEVRARIDADDRALHIVICALSERVPGMYRGIMDGLDAALTLSREQNEHTAVISYFLRLRETLHELYGAPADDRSTAVFERRKPR